MTLQEYLSQVWQQLEQIHQPLSLIIAQVEKNSPKKRIELHKLANVMRSVLHGTDDFVGFGHNDDVVMILPQTDLGEALQILYQIQDYYDEKVQKLELMTTTPSENSMIEPLLTKINANLHQFN